METCAFHVEVRAWAAHVLAVKSGWIAKFILLAGAAVLIAVLLTPDQRVWTTYNRGYIEHREIEYAQWIGRMLAVIVGTGVFWYITPKKLPTGRSVEDHKPLKKMTNDKWLAIILFVRAEFEKQGSYFRMDVDIFMPLFGLGRDDYLEICDRLSLSPKGEHPFTVRFQPKGNDGAPCDCLIFSR